MHKSLLSNEARFLSQLSHQRDLNVRLVIYLWEENKKTSEHLFFVVRMTFVTELGHTELFIPARCLLRFIRNMELQSRVQNWYFTLTIPIDPARIVEFVFEHGETANGVGTSDVLETVTTHPEQILHCFC